MCVLVRAQAGSAINMQHYQAVNAALLMLLLEKWLGKALKKSVSSSKPMYLPYEPRASKATTSIQ